jgi:hypothetical protein
VNVSGNINASTIDNLPISSFAFQNQTNVFVSQQQFNGNGSGTMLVGDPGCGAGYAGIGFNALARQIGSFPAPTVCVLSSELFVGFTKGLLLELKG